MSTQIKTNMKDHYITRFWGGDDRGICLQISSAKYKLCKTAREQIQEPGFIHLTMIEAAFLATVLADFVSSEAKRRKLILLNPIDGMKNMEKTVFGEVEL